MSELAMAHQLPVTPKLFACRVRSKERRLRSFCLHRNDDGQKRRQPVRTDHLRNMLDGWLFKDLRHVSSFAETLLDARDEHHQQQRVAAQLEEVILDADRTRLEQLLPNRDDFATLADARSLRNVLTASFTSRG